MNALQLRQNFAKQFQSAVDILDSPIDDGYELGDMPRDEFFATYLKITDRNTAELIPFVMNRAQLHFSEAVESSWSNFHLLIKSRQEGFSTFIQGIGFCNGTMGNMLGMTMADNDKHTQNMRDIANTFFDNLPKELGITRSSNSASTTVYNPTGSKVSIETAGGKSPGRSGTYTFFHGSEVAFWKDTKKIIKAALQGLSKHGLCIFETTANGTQGWVWETVNNPGVWHIHFYAWWWEEEYELELLPDEIVEYTEDELKCIDLARDDGFELSPEQIKWRRLKQGQLKEDFSQEYPETLTGAFLTSSSGGVFDARRITFVADMPDYDPTHIYAAGIDWGQDNDFSSLSISDRTAKREVFLGRWRRQRWAVMREEMLKQLFRYRVRFIVPEKNSMGSSQIESLWDSIEQLIAELAVVAAFKKEQWHQLTAPGSVLALVSDGHELRFSGNNSVPISNVMNWYLRFLVDTYDILSDECIMYRPDFGIWECELKPFTMGNINKHEAVTFFRTGLEDYGYALLDDETGKRELITYESKRTSTNAYSYSAPSGGHADTIIARMLSYIAMVSFE